MAITFFGSAAVPTDNGTNATATITVTPPTSMQVGDLVVVICRQRGTGVWTNGLTGGQTWTDEGNNATTSTVSINTFWCRFNGTWDVNPRFDNAGATNTSLVMLVFRPTSTSSSWALEFDNVSNNAATTLQTITGITPTKASNVSIASWHTADDNTWGTLTGTNWILGTLAAQYRNLAGSDGSCTHAYQIQTVAAPTNNVSKTQLTLGADATATRILNFYEFTSNTYNDSVSLSSTHQTDASLLLVLNSTISLSIDGDIVSTSIADIMAVADINSDSQTEAINNLISDVSAVLSLNSTTTTTAGSEFDNAIILASDNAIVPLLSLVIDSSLTLSQNSQTTAISALDAQNNIALQTDNSVSETAILNINTVATLQSDNSLTGSNTALMSEALSFQTDSTLLDNNFAAYLNNVALLTDGQIAFTYDEFGALVVDLVTLSQMTISEQADKLAQMQLAINNDLIFASVMEIYGQMTLAAEIGLLTVANIISFVDTFFDLNVSSELLTECAMLFEDNSIYLNSNAMLDFIGELNNVDYSDNEVVQLLSTITNTLLLKSLICSKLLSSSGSVNSINSASVITGKVQAKSTITNSIIANSKIK